MGAVYCLSSRAVPQPFLTFLFLGLLQAPVRREDPTLPPPWQCLFEPTQNATYYWNPTSNVTQYERPVGGPPPVAAAPIPPQDPYASQVW